jgi:hypothetical protein
MMSSTADRGDLSGRPSIDLTIDDQRPTVRVMLKGYCRMSASIARVRYSPSEIAAERHLQ